MNREKGKKTLLKSKQLGIFPSELDSIIKNGCNKYLDELENQKTQSKKLDIVIKKLERIAKKDNFIMTRKDIDNYFSESTLSS